MLFACVHNAGRSQMAAAFFRMIADPARVEGVSAGLEPADRVHPAVVQAMQEVGVDLSAVRPIALTARLQTEVHFLVTLGCGERCPLIPAQRREDWEIPDPTDQPLARIRQIRDDIRARVARLVDQRGWRRGVP